MLSLFSMADDHICRRGSSVFLVWAVTIMLVGCDRDALGPKRARGRRVGKWGVKIGFHDLNSDRSPKDRFRLY